MNELREEIELPPIEDTFGLGIVPPIEALRQREAQLLSSLAANREHERQFSDIQDSIVATFKDFERTTPEHFASQIRFVCSYYRGAMETINALDAAKKELELANREQKAEIERLCKEVQSALSCLAELPRLIAEINQSHVTELASLRGEEK